MQILCDYVLLFALCSDLKYGAGNVEFALAFHMSAHFAMRSFRPLKDPIDILNRFESM